MGIYLMGPSRAVNGSHVGRPILSRHVDVMYPSATPDVSREVHRASSNLNSVESLCISFVSSDSAPVIVGLTGAGSSPSTEALYTSASQQKERLFESAIEEMGDLARWFFLHHHHHQTHTCTSTTDDSMQNERSSFSSASVSISRPLESLIIVSNNTSRPGTSGFGRRMLPMRDHRTSTFMRSISTYAHETMETDRIPQTPCRNDILYATGNHVSSELVRKKNHQRATLLFTTTLEAMGVLRSEEMDSREALEYEEEREIAAINSGEVGNYLKVLRESRTRNPAEAMTWRAAAATLFNDFRREILRDFNCRSAAQISEHSAVMESLQAQLSDAQASAARGCSATCIVEPSVESRILLMEKNATNRVDAEVARRLRLHSRRHKSSLPQAVAGSPFMVSADGAPHYFPSAI